MNGFLLDTNIPSEQIKPRGEPRVGLWLYAQPEDLLFLSAVTVGELRKGIALMPAGKRRLDVESWFEGDLLMRFSKRILPVTGTIANRWGILTAGRQVAGIPLSVPDGLIAATALKHDLTLVTRNVRDFVQLGVTVFNPWEA